MCTWSVRVVPFRCRVRLSRPSKMGPRCVGRGPAGDRQRGRDDRCGSNGRFWPRGRFGAIPTPLPPVLMQSLNTCRRSTLPGPLPPVEVVRRTLELVKKARFWPSRASSREIDVTSPDATADGRDQRRTHETHLERRGSLQSEEMATNRARARTSSAPIGSAWFESPQMGPNRLIFFILSHFLGGLRL